MGVQHYSKLHQEHYTSGKCTREYLEHWEDGASQTATGMLYFLGLTTGDHDLEAKQLSASAALLTSALFCRVIDNFQTYIISLVTRIFSQNPRMIPKLQIPASSVFEISDIYELRNRVIEMAATKYSYMNVVDLSDELRKQFSFTLFDGSLTTKRVRRLIEIRNIVVHNRGKVNSTFISKVGCKFDSAGCDIKIPSPIRTDNYFQALASNIDNSAVQKFKLESVYA